MNFLLCPRGLSLIQFSRYLSAYLVKYPSPKSATRRSIPIIRFQRISMTKILKDSNAIKSRKIVKGSSTHTRRGGGGWTHKKNLTETRRKDEPRDEGEDAKRTTNDGWAGRPFRQLYGAPIRHNGSYRVASSPLFWFISLFICVWMNLLIWSNAESSVYWHVSTARPTWGLSCRQSLTLSPYLI